MNIITLQARVYGPYLPATELLCIEKNKQRSVSVEHKELEVYVTGARVGPQCLVTMESYSQESQKAAEVGHKKSLLWVITRRRNQDYLAIPSWVGFNISTRNQMSISKDIVGYLPTINASATEVNTVFEILNKSELIRKELLVEMIVLVMFMQKLQ